VSYKYTPHVCFKYAPSQVSAGGGDLQQVLGSNLRAEFDSAQTVNVASLATLTIVLKTAAKSFSAVLGESKYEKDEWVLIVGPPDGPSLLDRLRGQKSVSSPELELTCRKIHKVLAATPGISATRWYFEGPRSQGKAVSTPDELPWP
jgi:hypothetical protein